MLIGKEGVTLMTEEEFTAIIKKNGYTVNKKQKAGVVVFLRIGSKLFREYRNGLLHCYR